MDCFHIVFIMIHVAYGLSCLWLKKIRNPSRRVAGRGEAENRARRWRKRRNQRGTSMWGQGEGRQQIATAFLRGYWCSSLSLLLCGFWDLHFPLSVLAFLFSSGEEGEDQWEDEDAAGPGPWLWQGNWKGPCSGWDHQLCAVTAEPSWGTDVSKN